MTAARKAQVGLLLVLVVATLLGASATPAGAQAASDPVEPLVVLTGRADVRADEDVEVVVIFDGPATIDGTVQEAVVAFNGDVVVRGTVEEDVVAFNGRVTVEPGAEVGGDVVSRHQAVVDPAATVGGDVRRFDADVFEARFGWISRLAWWLAVTVSTLLLGLLLVWLSPRLVDATTAVGRTRLGAAVGWGLLALLAVPVAAVLLMVTLVGIPLGLWVLVTVAVVSVVGYVTAAWMLGARLVSTPGRRVAAFLAGLAVLRVLGLVPVLGGLLWAAAAVVGTGALVVATWRAKTGTPSMPMQRRGPSPAAADSQHVSS